MMCGKVFLHPVVPQSGEIISVGASLILMPIEFSRDNHGRARNSSTELGTVTTIGAAKSVARKWARNLLVY